MRVVKGELFQQLEFEGVVLPQVGAAPIRHEHMIVFIRKDVIKENQMFYEVLELADFIVADGKIIKNAWGRG